MAETPGTLQHLFNLPADLGTVKVPRVVHAFQGAHPGDRLRFLSSYYPMVLSGAIAQEGQHPSSVRGHRIGVTQAEMAAKSGQHRVTMTRRMRRLAASAKGYESARQRRAVALHNRRNALVQLELHDERCEVCRAGLPGTLPDCKAKKKLQAIAERPVPDLEHYERPAPVPVFYRRRRFGMASRYGVRMAQRNEMWIVAETATGAECSRHFTAKAAGEVCERLQAEAIARGSQTTYQVEAVKLEELHTHAPSIDQLASDGESGSWWDAAYQSDGYKAISKVWWHPELLDPETNRPIGVLARLVMSYYESRGLLEEFKDDTGQVTKAAGILEIKQSTVARDLGCDTRSVYRANCLWERLGVLRIAAGNPRKTEKGWRRGPQLVLYLPLRQLTDAEADLEAERMAQAVRQLAASQYARNTFGGKGALLQAVEAMRVHRELLTAWRGGEHCLVALWRECARRMTAAGISPDFTRACLPGCAMPGRSSPARPKPPDRN